MPPAKIGERPYLAGPKTQFSTPFFSDFLPIYTPQPRTPPLLFCSCFPNAKHTPRRNLMANSLSAK